MIKKFKVVFFTLIGLIIFISCSTITKNDQIYSSSTVSDNISKLEDIEQEIIIQYKEYNYDKINKIEKNLKNLLAQKSTDFEFLSNIHALYADYYLLKRNKRNAKRMLEQAKHYYPNSELVYLIESRFITHNNKKIENLTQLIKKHPTFSRLKAELGNAYYQKKDYANALAYFDSALNFLPEAYTILYGEKRNYSRKFYKVDSDINSKSSTLLQKDKIFLFEMTELTQDNSNTLDFITGTAKWKPLMLAEKLKANGWYSENSDLKNGNTTRKDAALFLWHLIAGNNSEKLSKYSRRFIKRNKPSPIKDVELDGIFFDSILGNIEEDIIPLVDGKEFKPDNLVTGLEFYNWLKKAEKLN